nr:MAG: hypothetical protein [White spot syndrome virus]
MKNSRQRSGVWRGNSCLYKSFYFSGAIIECKKIRIIMMFLLLSLILFVCFVGVVVGVIFMSRPNKTTTTSNKKTKKDKEKEKEDDTEGAVLGRREPENRPIGRDEEGAVEDGKEEEEVFEFEQPSVNTGSNTGGGGTGTVPGEGLLPPPPPTPTPTPPPTPTPTPPPPPTRTPSPSSSLGEDDEDDIDIDFDDDDIDEFLDSGEEMEEDEEEEDLDTLLSRLETGMSGEEVDFDASSAYIQPDPVVVKNIERSDYTLDPMESWKVLNRSEGDIRFFVDRGITNKIKAMTEDLKEL